MPYSKYNRGKMLTHNQTFIRHSVDYFDRKPERSSSAARTYENELNMSCVHSFIAPQTQNFKLGSHNFRLISKAFNELPIQ
eukprot:snap_masked-scaffold_50-processed-gene-1.51-mRNA-1 protein AED:1.00 eAED:1.00 QI:0/0/0/0/1/1/2/0/80